MLRACTVDIDKLRRDLLDYLDNELGNLVSSHVEDAKPTASFQRVMQRAAIHVQSSGPRGGDRRQRAGRACSPSARATPSISCRTQDMTRLRRGQLHLATASPRRPAAPSRAACRAPRRRSAAKREAARSAATTRSTPIASTSTRRRRNGKIDPLIGRETEVERTIQILCRRRKNNPLYVGDPGVGKTAIAEGLARAHRRGRRAGGAAERHHLRARHGRAARRHALPRRFRGAAEGGARPSSRRCRARSCSSTRSTP